VAAAVPAGVEEHPSTFGTAALAKAGEIAGGEQIGRRKRHRPEDSVERGFAILPGPCEAAASVRETLARSGHTELLAQGVQIGDARPPAFRRSLENSI
jgi:hypothetical protein